MTALAVASALVMLFVAVVLVVESVERRRRSARRQADLKRRQAARLKAAQTFAFTGRLLPSTSCRRARP